MSFLIMNVFFKILTYEDMKNLTQEKIIQCIGRIGRQEKNKHFSFRFRTQEHIDAFYSVVGNSIEVENMNRLFV